MLASEQLKVICPVWCKAVKLLVNWLWCSQDHHRNEWISSAMMGLMFPNYTGVQQVVPIKVWWRPATCFSSSMSWTDSYGPLDSLQYWLTGFQLALQEKQPAPSVQGMVAMEPSYHFCSLGKEFLSLTVNGEQLAVKVGLRREISISVLISVAFSLTIKKGFLCSDK